MISFPNHADNELVEVVDNRVHVGGRPVSDWVRIYGSPLYIYDARAIRVRIEALKNAFPDGVDLHYAMKANPYVPVVELISGLVDGLDVASVGELRIALQTQTPAHEISFAGPGKRNEELAAAAAAGVTVIVESETELERLIESAPADVPKVAVRVNPDFELKGSGMRMAGGAKQFGIDAERVAGMLQRLDTNSIEFQGLHIFSGSQCLSEEAICEAQSNALDLAIRLLEDSGLTPRFINLGGGFGIPYFPGDSALDPFKVGTHMKGLVKQTRQTWPETKLVVELGRYIVGEAGIYACEIIDVKESRDQTFLVTDGGLHHHLSASGNFGQVIRKNYPVALVDRVESEDRIKQNVVGPLCTPLDLLGDRTELPLAGVGDIVAVFQSGAYGFSASPHQFLGHPDPVQILVRDTTYPDNRSS